MNELVVFEYLVYTLHFQKLSRTFHVIISENSPVLGGAWWMLSGTDSRIAHAVGWTRGRLLQDPGKPHWSQLLCWAAKGKEEGGDVVAANCLGGRTCPIMALTQWRLFSCPVFIHYHCALGCFDCVPTVFTVIFGEIFNVVCCLFMVLFL